MVSITSGFLYKTKLVNKTIFEIMITITNTDKSRQYKLDFLRF